MGNRQISQDQFYRGRKVTTWSAHYVAGYDYSRQSYVAFACDSNGRAVPFSGEVEGDKFTITSEGATIGGAPVKLRMVWDVPLDSTKLRWRRRVPRRWSPVPAAFPYPVGCRRTRQTAE